MTDFQNFIGNFVKEITVMRNHDHNAFKPVQVILQPGYHLIIQMVGRLIQNQDVYKRQYRNLRLKKQVRYVTIKRIDGGEKDE